MRYYLTQNYQIKHYFHKICNTWQYHELNKLTTFHQDNSTPLRWKTSWDITANIINKFTSFFPILKTAEIDNISSSRNWVLDKQINQKNKKKKQPKKESHIAEYYSIMNTSYIIINQHKIINNNQQSKHFHGWCCTSSALTLQQLQWNQRLQTSPKT